MANIVTNGLQVYYHYLQGYTPTKWSNIAPGKTGLNDSILTGTTLLSDGVYFDSIDDKLTCSITSVSPYTIEMVIAPDTTFLSLFSGSTGSDYYEMYVMPDNTLQLQGANDYDSWYMSSIGASGLVSKQTNILTLVNVNGNIDVFLNGTLKTSMYTTLPSRLSGFFYHSGAKVTAIRTYSRNLSQAEITQNATVGTAIGIPMPTNHQIYGRSNGVSSSIAKAQEVRTANDFIAYGESSGTSTSIAKLDKVRTANDFDMYANANGFSASSSQPIISTPNNFLGYARANNDSASSAKPVLTYLSEETPTEVSTTEIFNSRLENKGIDTKSERDALNYSPEIQPPEKKSSGGTLLPSGMSETTLEKDNSIHYPATDIYIKIGDTYNYVSNLVSRLKDNLKDSYIPIGQIQLDAILSTNVIVDGLENITIEKGIPFEVYDSAIESPDNPTYSLIEDVVESYAEDIDGNIQLELYPDAKVLSMNLEELHYVLGETVYGRLVDSSQIPDNPTIDNDFYEKMKEQEKKQQEAYTALQNLHKINETVYYELLTTSYESSEYFEALAEYEGTKRELDDFSRRINQQTDFVSLAQIDSSMTSRCARRINRYVISESVVDKADISNLLSKQYEDSTQVLRACAQMQTATKLQINKQIETKQQSKDLLKTTGGMALKKRVHDEVINLSNIRNDVYLDLYGMMNNMIDPTRSTGVESFLNQVSEGMGLVRDSYKNYLQEMYQAHMIDQEVRFNKVNLTGDKQIARDSYWLLDNLLK